MADEKNYDLLEKMYSEFTNCFKKTDKRFDQIENHLEKADKRFDQIDSRLDNLESDNKEIVNRLDNLESDNKEIKSSQHRLENRMNKLEIRLETEVIDKIRALFDAREVQNDVNKEILQYLKRIEEKVGAHEEIIFKRIK